MSTLPLRFDGATFEPAKDAVRLTTELYAVRELMLDGKWRSLGQIVWALSITGKNWSEAGVSARLRDLRKPRFGGYRVDRQRIQGGLFEYRVRANG